MLFSLILSLTAWAQDKGTDDYVVAVDQCERLLQERKYHEGIDFGERASTLAVQLYGEESKESVRAKACWGGHLVNNSQVQEAEKVLTEMKGLSEQMGLTDDVVYASILHDLGESYWYQRKMDKIETLWKRSLEIRKTVCTARQCFPRLI